MKRLLIFSVVLMLTAACAKQEVAKDMTRMDLIDLHCREHVADFVDFRPSIYNECVELHAFGLVLTDSEDEHLSVLHSW